VRGKLASLDPGTVEGLFLQAYGAGATIHGPGHAEWDISERCESPVQRHMHVSTYRRGDHYGTGSNRAVWVELWTRCRHCVACLRMRRKLWTARACQEMRRSKRTWMVTLTLRPEEHYRVLAALSREKRSEAEEFIARHEVIGKTITKYLKRVRAESGSFRYLLVLEAHKSGLPHYHLLVHEGDNPLRWECLTEQWSVGYVQAVLVKDGDLYKETYYEHNKRRWRWTTEPGAQSKVARYVAKYLAKSVLARVRASQRYGDVEAVSGEVAARSIS